MNKIYFTIIVINGFLLFGCNKSLNITPNGRITIEDVFQNEKETEAYLNTVYSDIPSYARSYGTTWTLLAGITDDAQDASSGDQVDFCFVTPWIAGALTPGYNPIADRGNGNAMDHYSSFWDGIRNANVFLENLDHAPFNDTTRKNRFKAEATLLRAFYYWELVKQYGPMPIFDKPLDPNADFSAITRPTFQDNIDFIVKDCNAAIANPNFPLRITTPGESSRFSKAVAYAIKSEATLYNASPLWNPTNDISKWKAAAQASNEALDALIKDGEYGLYPDYGEYFLSQQDFTKNPRDKETIYQIMSGNPGVCSNIPSKQPSWVLGDCPTQELVDAYDMQATGEPAILGYNDDNHLNPIINPTSGYDPNNPYVGRDPRFYATVWYNGAEYDNINGAIHTVETYVGGADEIKGNPPYVLNTHTGYYLRKGIDPKLTTAQSKNNSWKKYRLAEIYLNLAEAENEATGPDQIVYNAVNTIRRRANMPDLPAGLSQDEMRIRIRRERRVEMPYEEQRFWDVRRWKIINQTDKLVTGMEIIKNSDGTFSYTRFVTERRNAWQDKFLIFPIPIQDASIIPDFTTHQNPGW